jgi:hypothetical protein
MCTERTGACGVELLVAWGAAATFTGAAVLVGLGGWTGWL